MGNCGMILTGETELIGGKPVAWHFIRYWSRTDWSRSHGGL